MGKAKLDLRDLFFAVHTFNIFKIFLEIGKTKRTILFMLRGKPTQLAASSH